MERGDSYTSIYGELGRICDTNWDRKCYRKQVKEGKRWSKNLGKKGAVTIYIVIGLIILIVASVSLYFITQQISERADSQRVAIQKLPSEIQPVVLLVDNCLSQVAREGVELLGQQGGYASIPQKMRFNFFPTESDGVSLTKDDDAPKIPYWYHLSSPSNCVSCTFGSNTPSIAQMEASLKGYIERNLGRCIGNFSSFKEQYEIDAPEEPSVRARIGETVSITLEYPIKINLRGASFSHNDFSVNLPVNILKMHDLASKITKYETDTSFMERVVLNLISTYSSSESLLPPFSGTSLSFDKNIWVKSSVMDLVQDMLRDSFFLITIPGTRNFYPPFVDENEPGEDVKQGYYYSMVAPVLGSAVGSDENSNSNANDNDNAFSNVDANFFYLDWPLYFDISPRNGELIMPEELKANFGGFLQLATQSYDFSYDIGFPVVVELRDPSAFNGDGFSFMFSIEGNIRDNIAFKGGDYNFLISEGRSGGNEDGDGGSSLFSSPEQRISGTITAKTIDDMDNPVGDVNAEYFCGSESMYVGKTNELGILETKLPICLGGIMKFFKSGYHGANIPLNTAVGRDDSVSARLLKIYEKDVDVKVRRSEFVDMVAVLPSGSITVHDINNLLLQGESEMSNEEVIISLTKVKDNELEDTFTSALHIDSSDTDTSSDTTSKKINLVPGKYTLSITYLDNNGVVIEEAEKKIKYKDYSDPSTGFGLRDKEEKITLPRIELNPAPLGGAILDEQNGYWIVNNDDLRDTNKNVVTMYVMRQPDPETHEELKDLGNIRLLSDKYTSLIEPQWG